MATKKEILAEINKLNKSLGGTTLTPEQRARQQTRLSFLQKKIGQKATSPTAPEAPPSQTPFVVAGEGVTKGLDPSLLGNQADADAMRRAIEMIRSGELFGRNIISEFLPEGSFGRLDEARSVDEQALLDLLRGEVDRVSQRSPELEDIIRRRQAGLEGYDAPENQALREAMGRELDSVATTQMEQLRRAQAAGQIRGAAAQGLQNRVGLAQTAGRQNIEQNLMIENVAEKQRRLGAYEGMMRGLEQEEAGRRGAAQNAFTGASQWQTQADLAKKQFNIGQGQGEKAAQLGAIFGGIGSLGGFTGGLRGEEAAEANQRRVADMMREMQDSYRRSVEDYRRTLR